MHIAVAGNIGSGKTTLTKMLADYYGWKGAFEEVDNNPYLKDFYLDMHRWSFQLEVFFLNHRFHQLEGIKRAKQTVIQDRTIYEGTEIFAENLFHSGFISDRDFRNLMDLYQIMTQVVAPPDLLIYLRSDLAKLEQQIKVRGRDFEKTIDLKYIENLNWRYEKWIRDYSRGRILILDVNELDYVNNPADFKFIVEQIDIDLDEIHQFA
ncbi:deoxynucleoside kinase [Xanthovirga aplysinae]|uniref:deoxynucleoside kinase n=1 Tax=Xanthovirga aplysinae TaxID=2529853 RepID=UPI0012BCC9DF|nr:deoxynucleoside kinase [Xanthovirga aplysinae]MTI31275.1 deoxynucleoside kinase [Xanthovirga aplysinae]